MSVSYTHLDVYKRQVLGFGGIAGSAIDIAKILFVVFLVLAVLSFFLGKKGPMA